MHSAVLAAIAALGAACGSDSTAPPLFPANYRTTYQEVRNCRHSNDHDQMTIRVLASPEAYMPYMTRTAPFPTGAIVLKEQYDMADTTCAGPIERFTVMEKLDDGAAPAALDWEWQQVDGSLHTMAVDLKRCISCHTDCGQPANGGYAGTCTQP